MANEFRTLNSHSAEYFGDTRDYWWNLDFLELIGKRLSLDRVQDVLDVGSGVGHWGQLLAKILPSRARVQGVDRDPIWIEKATARAAALGLADRFSYQVAVAEKLPFADASFDLVTCQTILIRMPDPGAVVDEMVRVARPGGLILAAEPNNVARALMFDSVSFHDPVDTILARARLQLICERGKAALGEGNNSIGDLVPSLFAERVLVDVRVYVNDKADRHTKLETKLYCEPPFSVRAHPLGRLRNFDVQSRRLLASRFAVDGILRPNSRSATAPLACNSTSLLKGMSRDALRTIFGLAAAISVLCGGPAESHSLDLLARHGTYSPLCLSWRSDEPIRRNIEPLASTSADAAGIRFEHRGLPRIRIGAPNSCGFTIRPSAFRFSARWRLSRDCCAANRWNWWRGRRISRSPG